MRCFVCVGLVGKRSQKAATGPPAKTGACAGLFQRFARPEAAAATVSVCVRAPASSSQRSRPDTAAAKRGAETGSARPMPPFRIGSMSGAVQPALVRRGDSSVSPVRPERRQTKGVARVSSIGGCLSRERRRAAKFELRLCPHNTRRWSTDEGDYVLSMRGWPLLRSLLSNSMAFGLGGAGRCDRHRNAREACRRACSEICRRLGGPARVCAPYTARMDQDQNREPSYWSDCTEWSNGLDAFRPRDPAKKPSPACAKALGCRTRMHQRLRSSNGTT